MNTETQTNYQQFPTTKAAVLSFVNAVLSNNISQTFTGEELRNFASARVIGGTTPSSIDRALRQLRQESKLGYTVINRGKSLYRAEPVSY